MGAGGIPLKLLSEAQVSKEKQRRSWHDAANGVWARLLCRHTPQNITNTGSCCHRWAHFRTHLSGKIDWRWVQNKGIVATWGMSAESGPRFSLVLLARSESREAGYPCDIKLAPCDCAAETELFVEVRRQIGQAAERSFNGAVYAEGWTICYVSLHWWSWNRPWLIRGRP